MYSSYYNCVLSSFLYILPIISLFLLFFLFSDVFSVMITPGWGCGRLIFLFFSSWFFGFTFFLLIVPCHCPGLGLTIGVKVLIVLGRVWHGQSQMNSGHYRKRTLFHRGLHWSQLPLATGLKDLFPVANYAKSSVTGQCYCLLLLLCCSGNYVTLLHANVSSLHNGKNELLLP